MKIQNDKTIYEKVLGLKKNDMNFKFIYNDFIKTKSSYIRLMNLYNNIINKAQHRFFRLNALFKKNLDS